MSRFGGGAPLRSIPEEEASDLPSPKDDVSSTTSFSLPRVFMNPSVRFLTAAAFFEDDLCPAPAEPECLSSLRNSNPACSMCNRSNSVGGPYWWVISFLISSNRFGGNPPKVKQTRANSRATLRTLHSRKIISVRRSYTVLKFEPNEFPATVRLVPPNTPPSPSMQSRSESRTSPKRTRCQCLLPRVLANSRPAIAVCKLSPAPGFTFCVIFLTKPPISETLIWVFLWDEFSAVLVLVLFPSCASE
mmetsp:Transcript_4527/g.16788  ORF Transcript_4527/g.16788 Transcript_4527/m.16788 type:complete len:246 (-) Transcript_4527:1488-2225(-)